MENLFSYDDPTGSGSSEDPGKSTASNTCAEDRTTPSDRAGTPKQLSVVLTAGRESGELKLTVTSADVARKESVTLETATQTLRFATNMRLFTGARGKFAVTDAGWLITQRWQEDETHARLLLQAQLLRTWPAEAASEALQDGPMPVERLAQHLQRGLPGKPRRGVYLVEWLELAFLVHRDRHGLMWPAPALGVVAGSRPAGFSDPASSPAPEPEQEAELDALMGMTNSKLRELPPEGYCAVLGHLAQLLEWTPA
ncbi:hypothetical protein [Streptomyces asiaticus]|uniref:hypothetical protein n=1 Tax=Streptomyces asiaticus TaxID=114695 RepID=UPI003F6643D8